MMNKTTRKDFIKTAALAGLAFTTHSIHYPYRPLLSFSTLGCPDWSLATVLNFAVEHGYDGIEIRGIQRQLELPKHPQFNSSEHIAATLKLIKNKRLKIVDLGCSAEMHHADASKRMQNLDEAKSYIQLAHQLSCPFIRVFPNNFPKDQEKKETIDLIVKNLQTLGDFAKGTGVKVLMETHGDLVRSEDITLIMRSVASPEVGLVWDILNMWSVTREPVLAVYEQLKEYIYHTHIRDLKLRGGEEEDALLGKGDTPIFEAIDRLAKDKFKGYYGFEWDKLWKPKIEEPEIAIADYSTVMREHFKRLNTIKNS